MFHWNTIRVLQRRIEWKLDMVPYRYVAGRLIIVAQVAAFEIAEVSDIVHRHVAPANFERPLSCVRQRGALGEKWIEDNASAAIAFAPHSEITREFLAQNVTSLLVGLDRQTNRRGRACVQ